MITVTSTPTRLSMREAAAYLQHSYPWIHANHRSIGLHGYRIGGRWFFELEDLVAYETSQKEAAGYKPLKATKPSKKGRVKF